MVICCAGCAGKETTMDWMALWRSYRASQGSKGGDQFLISAKPVPPESAGDYYWIDPGKGRLRVSAIYPDLIPLPPSVGYIQTLKYHLEGFLGANTVFSAKLCAENRTSSPDFSSLPFGGVPSCLIEEFVSQVVVALIIILFPEKKWGKYNKLARQLDQATCLNYKEEARIVPGRMLTLSIQPLDGEENKFFMYLAQGEEIAASGNLNLTPVLVAAS